MTYYEAYKKCHTIEDIKAQAAHDTKVAIFLLGNNPGRIKAIEAAMDKAIKECGNERQGSRKRNGH